MAVVNLDAQQLWSDADGGRAAKICMYFVFETRMSDASDSGNRIITWFHTIATMSLSCLVFEIRPWDGRRSDMG